ncbi:MAG: sensor histidine kinase [Bacteroidota bacterium]
MKHFSLFVFIICTTALFADNRIDSLIKAASTQTDTNRVKTLNELCFAMVYNDVDAAKKYGFEALASAEKIGFTKGRTKAYIRIGIVYDVASDLDSAIWYYDKALALAIANKDLNAQASALNNKAMVYSNRGLYPKAMVMYLNALRTFERMHDTLGTANALNNIAVLYDDMHKYRQSLVYGWQALNTYESIHNRKGMAAAYTNIALAYDNVNTDSCYKYARLALNIKEELNDKFGLGISYNDMGIFFTGIMKPDSSIYYIQKSLAIKHELNDEFGEASCLINISNAYQQKGDYKKQLECLDKALDIAYTLKSFRLIARAAFGLSSTQRNLGDYQMAYRYLRLHGNYRDSLITEENTKNINELDARYQSEKKDLQLANSSLALKASEATVGRNRAQLTLLIVLLSFVIISSLFVYFIYVNRQKRKAVQNLIEQEQLRNKAVITAENEERKRIAKDLHDGVGQQLSAVKMNLSAYSSKNNTTQLTDIMNMLDDAVKEVRSVSHSMVPNALLHAGLASAIRDFMNNVALSGKLQVDVQLVGIKDRLDEKKETTLFRIVQECVTNITRHAEAGRLTLQLIHHPEHLTLMIEDDGKGFNVKDSSGGIGIKNIESRVAYINGTLDIDSQPGRGTTITVEIPH